MNEDLQILQSVCLHVSMNRGIPSPNNTQTHTTLDRRWRYQQATTHTHTHAHWNDSLFAVIHIHAHFQVGWMLETQKDITNCPLISN